MQNVSASNMNGKRVFEWKLMLRYKYVPKSVHYGKLSSSSVCCQK